MTVGKILANPKYIGYMVYGRTKNTGKYPGPGPFRSLGDRPGP